MSGGSYKRKTGQAYLRTQPRALGSNSLSSLSSSHLSSYPKGNARALILSDAGPCVDRIAAL
jgi:hypothetical protein